MARYRKDPSALSFSSPGARIFALGAVALLIAAASFLITIPLSNITASDRIMPSFLRNLLSSATTLTETVCCVFIAVGIVLMICSGIVHVLMSDSKRIQIMVRRGLFDPSYGNPLKLKENERLPKVTCKETAPGKFEVTITATAATVEDIQNVSSSISSSLNKKKYTQFAVVATTPDLASNHVKFSIDDVNIKRELIVTDVEKLRSTDPTKLIIQQGTYIDLTTSGSMLVAGKTRSGKTTGIISILFQVLLSGRDNSGSMVTIIDPKVAELSRLPYVITLDVDNEATGIMGAVKVFLDTIRARQKVLNELADDKGDVVKWHDEVAKMRVSLLFIDEYVSLRAIIPKRASAKEGVGYNIETFDAMLKQIITMGASAGCYVILSIAEASVESGGLPAMLRSAMSTRILFRPTLPEGRLMWDGEKLKNFPERTYNPGDAWFSSTDGINDNVTFVHFPIMEFPVYRELGRLLRDYYEGSN